MGAACTFNYFNVVARHVNTAGANTMTLNLVVNNVDQALGCSFATTNATVGTMLSCNDTAPTVSVNAGDIVAIKYVQTSSTPLIYTSVVTKCN